MPTLFDQNKLYCSTEDVARYITKVPDFTSTTSPTATQVEAHIAGRCDFIDRYTGHSWRNNQKTNEYHDLKGRYYYWAGRPINLVKREIKTPLDPAEGDKIEVFTGDGWEDWVADDSKTEGRNGEYWVDPDSGILYIYQRLIYQKRKALRISYRYGHPQVPRDVREAAAMFTAIDLVQGDQYRVDVPGTDGASGGGGLVKQAEELEGNAYAMLEQRKEVKTIGGL